MTIDEYVYEVPQSRLHRLNDFQTLVVDLDRCPHGRHEGDACAGWRGPGDYDGGCHGGTSLGNPTLRTGTVVGYDIGGRKIVMPPRGARHEPANWRGVPS